MKVAQNIYLNLLRAYAEELFRKTELIIKRTKKASLKSIEAGRGTITELAEINAANDKASADLFRVKQNIKTRR